MQVLDFSALMHNAHFFKNLLGDSRLCAVVKNNAYGHGIEHVARYLDCVVDFFAVGSVYEARQIGFVNSDILILLPQNEMDTAIAVKFGYVLTADSFETLITIGKVAHSLQMIAHVHIKIDSGMSRLGFSCDDMVKLADYLQRHREICVEGVYSHFYGENAWQCDKQFAAFLPVADFLENALNKRLIKHIANSGGALLSAKYHLDMARIGLGLYGYGNKNLISVKTIKAKVIAVKSVRAGAVVGYGGNYIAMQDASIAVINVGYAHGFARTLVNSFVEINGRKCKVLAVCMAMIIADVTDANADVWDDAILLGDGVNISNNETSVYELLCNLK